MSILTIVMLALSVPAVVAAVLVGVARAIGRWVVALAVPLAVGAGYLVGHLIVSWPKYPPTDVTDRLPWVALGATVLGVLAMAWPWGSGLRWLARLLMVEATIAVILGPILGEAAEARPNLLWLIALGNGILVAWGGLLALADRSRPGQLWPTLILVAGASSIVLIGSGSMVLGQLGLCLTGALMGCAVVGWKLPGASLSRGGAGVIVSIVAALLLDGHVYSGVSAPSLAFLAATPVLALIGCVGSSKMRKPWQGTVLTLVLATISAGAAVGFALAGAGE